MKYIFYFAFVIIFFGTEQEIYAQKSLQTAVNQYTAKQAKKQDAAAVGQKTTLADIDGDGDKDAVLEYTLEGFGGGNNWTQLMAVFLNQKGVYKFADEATVGGKFFTYTSTVSGILKGTIKLETETCEEPPQGICENPAKGTVSFLFSNGKLSEK